MPRPKLEPVSPASIKTVFTLLIGSLFADRINVAIALALTISGKVFAVASPVIFGETINAIGGSTGAEFWTPAVLLIAAYAGSRFLSSAIPHARDALFTPTLQNASRSLALSAYDHSQRLSLDFHLSRRAGALFSAIDRGSRAAEDLLRAVALTILPTIIEVFLATAVLWSRYGFPIALITLITMGAYAAFTRWITDWRVRQRRLLNESDTEFRARAIDALTNFETVKAFNGEEREARRFDESLRRYNARFLSAARSLALMNIGQELLLAISLLTISLFAAFSASEGSMKIGDFAAITMILIGIFGPLNLLGWVWRDLRQAVVDLENLSALLNTPITVTDRPNATALLPSGGNVQFKNVHFQHNGRIAGLSDISFEIEAGMFVGICGPSGAGKSTLLKLLFRFFDPSSGNILIDNQDITLVTQISVRKILALVPQEVTLFNDTLLYNIAYAAEAVNEHQLNSALEAALLGDLIRRLPSGLDTPVGERGLKLSGGERQRVGIARALLADPEILVFDEATSSLDSATERDVQSAIQRAAEGRTTIAVAHRLSTIAGADLILVMDGGRIVEFGKHNDLLAKEGVYAKMWTLQRVPGQST